MTIQITQAELWTWNTLNSSIANTQAELQRLVAARDDYLHKLELAYNAKFDPKTGSFYPVDGDKAKKLERKVQNEVDA